MHIKKNEQAHDPFMTTAEYWQTIYAVSGPRVQAELQAEPEAPRPQPQGAISNDQMIEALSAFLGVLRNLSLAAPQVTVNPTLSMPAVHEERTVVKDQLGRVEKIVVDRTPLE